MSRVLVGDGVGLVGRFLTHGRHGRGTPGAIVLGLALLCASVVAQETQPTSQPTGLPATLAGFQDEGVFGLYVNEERVATIHFTWKPDGAFENECTIAVSGQSVTRRLKIEPDADGRWKRIEADSRRGPVVLERDGATARRTIGDDVITVDMQDGAVLFENYSPALISQAVRRYDAAAGGKQTLALFIVPSAVMNATLERLDTVERAIAGRDVRFTRYTYGLPGVEMTAWVDEQQRLCLADVPAQHAAYVREGYEALRQADTSAQVSQPEYEVQVESNVRVPMRDGLALATDIYRPTGDGQFPVILVRTPYKKEMGELQARFYARRGYVFAIQDCRGRFSSPGEWEPFVHEAADGYDTIEWLAVQPWSTGKVGMIGASYLGWVQWWAASANPPHLVTIIPNVSPPDPFYNIPYEYGTFFLVGAIWWSDVLESEATADLSGAALSRINQKEFGKLLRALPVIDLDKAVLGQENRYWRKWIAHPVNDEYWQPANFLEKLDKVAIPVFHQSGWFDGDGIGAKLNYTTMKFHGHANQKLVLGPWGHTAQAERRVGDRDFGAAAIIDLQTEYLRWLDHWLKGRDNGVLSEPLVSIFVMGDNKWLHGDVYPLPQTRMERWYLSSGGNANTNAGDGRLTRKAPAPDEPPDRYTYDPGDPTPAPDFYEEAEEDDGVVRSAEEKKAEREAYHEKIVGQRKDILVYVTEPLTEPLTIAGPISAVLYASSSAKDTDWYVRLMEVDEAGKIFPLVEGRLRARYRATTKKAEFLEPGKVYEYHLDLWQTGITVSPGRRLRVEVASASFPMFSRNLNTGGHNETETNYVSAEQGIYHDAEHPSHIRLPVIP